MHLFAMKGTPGFAIVKCLRYNSRPPKDAVQCRSQQAASLIATGAARDKGRGRREHRMNSEDRSDGQVESGESCRITGLPILQKPAWTDVDFGRDYRVTLRVLGDRILYSRPSGFATRRDTQQALDFTQSVVQERFGNRRYVQIEDYTRLRGVSLDGRKAFIQGMRERARMVGVVFMTTSPVFKVSIQLAKRLTSSESRIHIAGDYEEAMRWAEDCLRGHGLSSVPASETPSREPSRVQHDSAAAHSRAEEPEPRDLLWTGVETHDAWTLHLKGFSIQYERPADDVVHTVSAGSLEEKHLDPLFKHMEDVFSSMGLEGVPFFLMNSLESVSTITWRARRLLTRKLASCHERFPFRLNVFYGVGGLLMAAIRMGRSMVPFQVAVAKDLPGAWDLVSEAREQGEGSDRRLSSFEPTQASIDDLLRFLGNLNWEVNGEEDSTPVSWDASHPLSPVFEAFSLIKHELDQLLEEREGASKALRESEERHRSILENMDEGYYETDTAGNFTFVNQAMSAVLGYTREELIGTNNRNYMDRETARNVYAIFNRVYESGRPEKGFEWETIRKDGSRRVVETSVSLKLDERGKVTGFRGLVRDVTERELAGKERARLEAQLQHAQRMEAVGTLAGGIAHNFNNLLMGIQGNASLMALDLPPDHPHGERIKTIEKLVRSGSELTRQLLGYAREGRYEVRPVDLNQVVQDTAGTFGAARKEIRVCTELCPSLHTVLADPGQIEQALMNLFVNAADAMPRGGDLVIRTKDVSSSDMKGKSYIPKEGEYALLEVQDTGLGMDEATRAKVFEPFFTTKGFSKGTGLGLASVYGIVKAHGGYIDVVSEEGRGTTFRMYLPSTEARPEVSGETEISFHKGEGAVLLVDDEEAVLDVGAEMLYRLNYLVYRARSGEEAVRLFQEKQELIRLVILDMIMPGMGGGEVFDRLKEIDPHVKVLLASGYSMDGNAAEILKRGCDDFIQKPFDLTVLSQKLGGLQRVRKEGGEEDA